MIGLQREFVDVTDKLRVNSNVAPENIPDIKALPEFSAVDVAWRKARSDLVAQVRGELSFRNPQSRPTRYLTAGIRVLRD
jgi:hypothetical protein